MDRYYDLGGVRVLVRLAAPALTAVTRSLDHRGVAPGDATMAVCVGGGHERPGAPVLATAAEWSPRRRPGVGVVADTGPIRALYVGTTGALSMLDAPRARALFWQDPETALPFESATPLVHIFTWWLSRYGRYPVHAGAVGTPTGGVLLAGTGGAGKSTTAFACLDSELLYAGDDYVLVSEHPPFVHSLYRSARISADRLAGLPRLEASIGETGPVEFGKVLLFLKHAYAHKPVAGFPLRAVLTLRVTGQRDSRLVPASAAQALGVLIPSSVIELPGLGHESVRAIVRIVRSVPSYVLEAGTDLAQLPVVISRLLGCP